MVKIQQKHIVLTIIFFLIVLLMVVIKIACSIELRIKEVDLSCYQAIDPPNVEYQLNSNIYVLNKQESKFYFRINGWITAIGKNNYPVKIHVVISDKNGRAYKLPTEVIRENELNKQFDDGFDHTWSGFSTYVAVPEMIKLDDEKYTVSIIYEADGTEYLVNTLEEVQSGEE